MCPVSESFEDIVNYIHTQVKVSNLECVSVSHDCAGDRCNNFFFIFLLLSAVISIFDIAKKVLRSWISVHFKATFPKVTCFSF